MTRSTRCSRHPSPSTSPSGPSRIRTTLRAELARVRAQGWALIDGELEPGLRSIAVPLHGRGGRVVAAVNVSTSATRDTVEHIAEAYLPPCSDRGRHRGGAAAA